MRPIAVALLLLSAAAHGRLGESQAECEARYGEVLRVETKIRPEFPQYVYAKAKVEIRIRFVKGIAGELRFCSPPAEMSGEMIRQMLDGNSQGSTWQIDPVRTQAEKANNPDSISAAVQAFKRADGKAVAVFTRLQGVGAYLAISSTDFEKAYSAPASGF